MSIFNSNKQKPDPTEEGLLKFSEMIGKAAIVLAGAVAILGLITAIPAAMVYDGWDPEFNFGLFLVALIPFAIYTVLTFLACALVSLLIKALAGIHMNTRICSELLQKNLSLDADKEEPVIAAKKTFINPDDVVQKDEWRCKSCNRILKNYVTTCPCGQEKSKN